MPHYFFHYHSSDRCDRDDMGCDFETLELAYLDAYRSVVEIGAEMIKNHQNPAGHWIDIADTDGRSLMSLHFDEIFRPKRRVSNYRAEAETFRAHIQKFRQLRDEMKEACVMAQDSVDKAHEILRRARAIP